MAYFRIIACTCFKPCLISNGPERCIESHKLLQWQRKGRNRVVACVRQPVTPPQSKRYFHRQLNQYPPHSCQACPTNGSDCGSLRDHNLTLFVRFHGQEPYKCLDQCRRQTSSRCHQIQYAARPSVHV